MLDTDREAPLPLALRIPEFDAAAMRVRFDSQRIDDRGAEAEEVRVERLRATVCALRLGVKPIEPGSELSSARPRPA